MAPHPQFLRHCVEAAAHLIEMLLLILTKLNDVAFGILTVAHAITVKDPLALRWKKFAAVQPRNCSRCGDAGNFKDQLDGCFCPAPRGTFDLD